MSAALASKMCPTVDAGEQWFTGWVSRLARRHTQALATIARREGLLAEDALDAVQEAFCTFMALDGARAVADHDHARRLLGRIVRNTARNMRRRHHRARPHVDVEDVPLLHPTDSVERLIEQAEAHVRLKGCIARLTAVQGNVVRLRMLEAVSTSAVAALLQLDANHVAVLLYRAKRSLAACIGEAS